MAFKTRLGAQRYNNRMNKIFEDAKRLNAERDANKTPGQIAYEADVCRQHKYHDGTARRSWDELPEFAKWSWERNLDAT